MANKYMMLPCQPYSEQTDFCLPSSKVEISDFHNYRIVNNHNLRASQFCNAHVKLLKKMIENNCPYYFDGMFGSKFNIVTRTDFSQDKDTTCCIVGVYIYYNDKNKFHMQIIEWLQNNSPDLWDKESIVNLNIKN